MFSPSQIDLAVRAAGTSCVVLDKAPKKYDQNFAKKLLYEVSSIAND